MRLLYQGNNIFSDYLAENSRPPSPNFCLKTRNASSLIGSGRTFWSDLNGDLVLHMTFLERKLLSALQFENTEPANAINAKS